MIGEAEVTAAAHARYFLGYAIDLSPGFTRGDTAPLDAAEQERDNLRSALRWVIDAGELELALEGAGAMWRFWRLRGHLLEGERVLAEVLAKAPETPTHGRARDL